MTPRVFLVEPATRYNIQDASRYGEVTALLDPAPSPFKTDVFASRVRSAVQNAKFQPEHDYFCMTGTQLNLALALSVICAEVRGPVKLLLFDAGTNTYFERIFEAAA